MSKTPLVAWLVALGLPALAGGSPSSSGDPLAALRARDPELRVSRSADGQTIETLAGRLSEPARSSGTTDPEAVARAFLAEIAPALRLREALDDLELVRAKRSPVGHHLELQQRVDGLPVFGAGVDVHLDPTLAVRLVRNRYVDARPVASRRPVTGAELVSAAERFVRSAVRPAVGQLVHRLEPEVTRGYLPQPSGLAPGARIRLRLDQPITLLELLVDAGTGEVAAWRTLMADKTGKGKVFDPNPIVALGDPSLNDQSAGGPDEDGNVFKKAYDKVKLRDIVKEDRRHYLVGPHVFVDDSIEAPYLRPEDEGLYAQKKKKFFFGRDDEEFEAVMVYYHLDEAQRYIQSLGFDDLNNRSHVVDPHGLEGADNSHYLADPPGAGYLSFGEGGVDDAEDADVILHEYGHSLQDNASGSRYFDEDCTTETTAMGEGFGDYWAAALTYEESVDAGIPPTCWAEWDAQGSCLRRLDTDKVWPDDLEGECHADGEIWSATLWDLTELIGIDADVLVLASHYLVGNRPDFEEGGEALLEADEIVYGGFYHPQICAALSGRGIRVPANDC